MKFQIKDLKKLLYSIQQKHVDEINVKSEKFKLIINKASTKESDFNRKTNLKIQRINKSVQNAPKEPLNPQKIANNDSENYSIIVSPMVGTFYRSPAPNEAAYVELNDIVQKKQTVCIIEAMKLMNEIEAEVNGEIVEILVQDGDIIDCGQALMRIKPTTE